MALLAYSALKAMPTDVADADLANAGVVVACWLSVFVLDVWTWWLVSTPVYWRMESAYSFSSRPLPPSAKCCMLASIACYMTMTWVKLQQATGLLSSESPHTVT